MEGVDLHTRYGKLAVVLRICLSVNLAQPISSIQRIRGAARGVAVQLLLGGKMPSWTYSLLIYRSIRYTTLTSLSLIYIPAVPLYQWTIDVEIMSSVMPFSLSKIKARCATEGGRAHEESDLAKMYALHGQK